MKCLHRPRRLLQPSARVYSPGRRTGPRTPSSGGGREALGPQAVHPRASGPAGSPQGATEEPRNCSHRRGRLLRSPPQPGLGCQRRAGAARSSPPPPPPPAGGESRSVPALLPRAGGSQRPQPPVTGLGAQPAPARARGARRGGRSPPRALRTPSGARSPSPLASGSPSGSQPPRGRGSARCRGGCPACPAAPADGYRAMSGSGPVPAAPSPGRGSRRR